MEAEGFRLECADVRGEARGGPPEAVWPVRSEAAGRVPRTAGGGRRAAELLGPVRGCDLRRAGHASLLPLDERPARVAAKPVIAPETVVGDRGKAYVPDAFRNACRPRDSVPGAAGGGPPCPAPSPASGHATIAVRGWSTTA
ncbi:hypothetical protein GCM10010398_40060 [Streptomyces fimbriatus]